MSETTAPEVSPYDDLACPLPGCHEGLFIEYQLIVPLSAGDLDTISLPTPGDAVASTWWVGCLAGHRVVIPARLHPDDDNGDTDELRTFRGIDRRRLAELLATLRQVAR